MTETALNKLNSPGDFAIADQQLAAWGRRENYHCRKRNAGAYAAAGRVCGRAALGGRPDRGLFAYDSPNRGTN